MRGKNVSRIFFFLIVQLYVMDLFARPFSQKKANLMVCHAQKAIEKAEQELSSLSKEVLKMEGMSSRKVRHLLNNLCSLKGGSYLEVGLWKGSTFVSALYGNDAALKHAIGIDNWSGFGGPEAIFKENCNEFLPHNSYTIIDEDSFTVDLTSIPLKVNVYFYDGDHTDLGQEKAFTYFDPIFDDVFVAVIDDWKRDAVKKGTKNAFRKLNYKILFEKELLSERANDHNGWWNGLYIVVLARNVG